MLQDSTVPINYYNIILSALNHVLGRYTPIYYIYYNIDKSTIGTALSYRGTRWCWWQYDMGHDRGGKRADNDDEGALERGTLCIIIILYYNDIWQCLRVMVVGSSIKKIIFRVRIRFIPCSVIVIILYIDRRPWKWFQEFAFVGGNGYGARATCCSDNFRPGNSLGEKGYVGKSCHLFEARRV